MKLAHSQPLNHPRNLPFSSHLNTGLEKAYVLVPIGKPPLETELAGSLT